MSRHHGVYKPRYIPLLNGYRMLHVPRRQKCWYHYSRSSTLIVSPDGVVERFPFLATPRWLN